MSNTNDPIINALDWAGVRYGLRKFFRGKGVYNPKTIYKVNNQLLASFISKNPKRAHLELATEALVIIIPKGDLEVAQILSYHNNPNYKPE